MSHTFDVSEMMTSDPAGTGKGLSGCLMVEKMNSS